MPGHAFSMIYFTLALRLLALGLLLSAAPGAQGEFGKRLQGLGGACMPCVVRWMAQKRQSADHRRRSTSSSWVQTP